MLEQLNPALLRKVFATAFELMGEGDTFPPEKGYRYYHGVRTMAIAIDIATACDAAKAICCEALVVGALFHDLGKADGPVENHGLVGARRFEDEVCPRIAVADPELVKDIITNHCRRGEAAYPTEVKLVQDADLVDHFGANAIWLRAANAAAERLQHWQVITHDSDRKEQQWQQYALSHCNFAVSRTMIEERIQHQVDFYSHWSRESFLDLLQEYHPEAGLSCGMEK